VGEFPGAQEDSCILTEGCLLRAVFDGDENEDALENNQGRKKNQELVADVTGAPFFSA
jgi:hypothetical protein